MQKHFSLAHIFYQRSLSHLHTWNMTICSYSIYITTVKGIVHPKMHILSPFTHPQVVPNLYAFISFLVTKIHFYAHLNKETVVWNNLRVSKWWQNVHFGCNIIVIECRNWLYKCIAAIGRVIWLLSSFIKYLGTMIKDKLCFVHI